MTRYDPETRAASKSSKIEIFVHSHPKKMQVGQAHIVNQQRSRFLGKTGTLHPNYSIETYQFISWTEETIQRFIHLEEVFGTSNRSAKISVLIIQDILIQALDCVFAALIFQFWLLNLRLELLITGCKNRSYVIGNQARGEEMSFIAGQGKIPSEKMILAIKKHNLLDCPAVSRNQADVFSTYYFALI